MCSEASTGRSPITGARTRRCIVQNYVAGRSGSETVAAVLGDQRDVVEEVIEPYCPDRLCPATLARPGSDRALIGHLG